MADSVDKPLLGFLNGIARRTYFGETQFTDEFLREDVLGGMAEEVYAALLRRYEALLLNIVSADMDYTQLDAFLTSQKKKRQGALTQREVDTVQKFWKSQKDKIHSRLVTGSVWDNSLKDLSWRVDVRTKARYIEQLNQPSAIVEMKLGEASDDKVKNVVRFELDSDRLAQLVTQVEDIQNTVTRQMHS